MKKPKNKCPRKQLFPLICKSINGSKKLRKGGFSGEGQNT